MKKSARVSEKLISPGLPGLQVATRLPLIQEIYTFFLQFAVLIFNGMALEIGGFH